MDYIYRNTAAATVFHTTMENEVEHVTAVFRLSEEKAVNVLQYCTCVER